MNSENDLNLKRTGNTRHLEATVATNGWAVSKVIIELGTFLKPYNVKTAISRLQTIGLLYSAVSMLRNSVT